MTAEDLSFICEKIFLRMLFSPERRFCYFRMAIANLIMCYLGNAVTINELRNVSKRRAKIFVISLYTVSKHVQIDKNVSHHENPMSQMSHADERDCIKGANVHVW